jgi:hypothetical protein
MRRISAYIISCLLICICTARHLSAQDTLDIPLKIKLNLEVSGPVIYYIDNDLFKAEGYLSVDLNEKRTFVFGGGYVDYKYSQYNYIYHAEGIFATTGLDFNFMKPEKSMGRYWAGIGLRYGLSHFTSGAPSFQQDNYWGTTISSIPEKPVWSHFLEASPGVKAELTRNFSIGWTVNLRMLLYSGTSKDLKPVYIPGYGKGTQSVTIGFSYFISINIPYRKIRVITKKEEPKEPEETEETVSSGVNQ